MAMGSAAALLRAWAEGMGGPAAEQAEELCSGPLADVWSWVAVHCKDEEHVRTVLGNLCLARRTAVDSSAADSTLQNTTLHADGESRELVAAERGRLVEAVHGVLARAARLRGQVAEQGGDRRRVEGQRQEAVTALQHRRQRTVLLGLYAKQARQKIESISKLAEVFENIVIKKEAEDIKSPTYCSDKGVESENERNIREAVEATLEYMKSSVSQRAGREAPGRAQVRARALALAGGVRPGAALLAMLDQTNQLVRRVRRTLAGSDSGAEGEEPCEASSVQAEVSKLCCLHIAACRAVAAHRASIMELEARPGEPRGRETGEAASLRAELRRARAELAETEAGAVEGARLAEQVAEQARRTEEVCRVISQLVARDHLSAAGRVQAATLALLTGPLPARAAGSATAASSLAGAVTGQLQALNSSSMSRLSSVAVSGPEGTSLTRTDRLGIHRDHLQGPAMEDAGGEALGRMVSRLERLRAVKEELAELGGGARAGLELERRASCLRAELAGARRQQEADLLPRLAAARDRRREGLAAVGRVAELRADWAEQEAGAVAADTDLGWGKVDGRSLGGAVRDVRVAVAKFNQTLHNQTLPNATPHNQTLQRL